MSGKPSRRDALVAVSWATLAGGVALIGRLIGTAVGPRQRPARRLVTAGQARALPPGGRRSLGEIILIRDERGIAAISSRCTHLGCTVVATGRGYECPCHGSTFAPDGGVRSGPARRPLAWYRVTLGADGELRVDLDAEVAPTERLAVGDDR